MIVPSHIVPLAAPGVIKQGLKWLLDPKSPFSIEFKPNWNMISWLLKFRSAANKKHVVKAANFLRQISLESRDIYKKLSDNMDFGFVNNGTHPRRIQPPVGEYTLFDSQLKQAGFLAVDFRDAGYDATELSFNHFSP